MTNRVCLKISVKAASTGDSIENTAKILKNIPTANDIRYHLDKINDFELLESQINQALKSRIPVSIKKGCLKLKKYCRLQNIG